MCHELFKYRPCFEIQGKMSWHNEFKSFTEYISVLQKVFLHVIVQKFNDGYKWSVHMCRNFKWGIVGSRFTLILHISLLFEIFQISLVIKNHSISTFSRSSRTEVFLAKGVVNICTRFTGEHPCRSVIWIKLICNFIEIILQHGCSPVNLIYIFRTYFLKNTSGWLLLLLLLFTL